ncbi:hypothetical protein [Pseudovibrio sp. WM33]|uniref:hypothetical protein n=1 Tax=Pseudovibrio sp. WM33 TaxID=1735585 RepID=UPI0007AE935B|nr:hypothetical protein [Pseudovibrio sp. WM33]KZL26481.1 hypothetical protein PsWM33_01403 [Pseudovibrio sp. WM33]
MNGYIKRISYDFSGYDEDEKEFVTYDEKPFTGVLYEELNGKLISEASVVQGIKDGYTLWYYNSGKVEQIQELGKHTIIGLLAKWDENGLLVSAEKRWSSLLVERLLEERGIWSYERVATEQQINESQSSPLTNMYNYRKESIYDLLAEAEEKIKNGTVFDDPRLYSEG